MPRPPAGADLLRTLGAALTPLRDCAAAAAQEALEHFPELGERHTQHAVDGYLDQVCDLLREVEVSTSELAARLHVASLGSAAEPGRPAQLRHADDEALR
jgi:hypothetical protein